MKIRFLIDWDYGKSWAEVDGEIVDIAPHLASVATFAVHRNPFIGWMVSNLETGARVTGICGTRSEAICAASDWAARFTPEQCQQKLTKFMRRKERIMRKVMA